MSDSIIGFQGIFWSLTLFSDVLSSYCRFDSSLSFVGCVSPLVG